MDYKNGKIYSIRSYQTDKIYIGSTTQPLSKRFSCHKSYYKQYLNGKHSYITSFEILQFEDAYIELIEELSCENKEQLCKREGELIRLYNCVNKSIAGRTEKEWKIENKEKIKEYREQNKDKMKEYQKQNEDRIKEYQKKYREQNKDKMKEYNKQYYQQKKYKLKE